jgi:hypothetical protein
MAKFEAKLASEMRNIFNSVVAIDASLLFGEYSSQLILRIAASENFIEVTWKIIEI